LITVFWETLNLTNLPLIERKKIFRAVSLRGQYVCIIDSIDNQERNTAGLLQQMVSKVLLSKRKTASINCVNAVTLG
jgi:hypothetical protein